MLNNWKIKENDLMG